MVAGNMYQFTVHQATVNEIQLLYQKLKEQDTTDLTNGSFCEQLEHYMAVKTEGDIRGLEDKLKSSDRADQLDAALQMKERATKAIMRLQSSKTAQRIYTIILDELHTDYMLSVSPLIQKDASREEVDGKISVIVSSVRDRLGENYLELTTKDILGLLYFLGGNCHVRWDKC